MTDYKKMYFQLAARVADAIDILVAAQMRGEDDYIKEENPAAYPAAARRIKASGRGDRCFLSGKIKA